MSTTTGMIVRATAMVAATKTLLLATSVTCLTLALPGIASTQEILLFPPKPSGSIANRTMQESVTARSLKTEAACRCAEYHHRADRRHRTGDAEHLWRRNQYADA